MLSLANLHKQIEALEEEEYSSTNAQLETWRNMCAWQYWLASLPDRDNWRKDFEALPKEHEARQLYNSLMWFTGRFADVLPQTTWLAEKAGIAFECWIQQAIEENYTESALATEEALNDCLTFVSTCLQNGSLDRIDELKRQEAEQWAKKLEFRRLAHEGRLSEEAEEWLRINDSAFLENLTAKKQSEVKPEVKPVASETIENSRTMVPILPEVPKPVNDYVSAFWSGLDEGWLVDSLDGTLPVHRGRLYRLSLDTWLNIQSDSYLRQRWHEVKE